MEISCTWQVSACTLDISCVEPLAVLKDTALELLEMREESLKWTPIVPSDKTYPKPYLLL